jgi:hypothetical protein
VAETCYKDVFREVCRFAPETKKVKKWVYSCIDEPFCVPDSRNRQKACGHKTCEDGCSTCASCAGPYHRKLLIKREIVIDEICEPKCVVETVIEKVAYKVYHAIPCSQGCPPGMNVVVPAPARLAAPVAPAVTPVPENLKAAPIPVTQPKKL